MDFKSYDDVLKLQQQFTARLGEQLQAVKKARPASGEAFIADKRAMLQVSQAAIESLQRAKDEAVRRLDAELARHKKTVAQLQQDLDAFEKAQREADKAAGKKTADKPAAKTRKPATKR
jgi:peptidoglycan hydrolase CwlO-like protein